MSFFDLLELYPEDPILGLPKIFKSDPHPQKVNLGIGAYQDSEGKPFILTTVRDAEKEIIKNESTKEYLPIEGDPDFIQETLKIVYGEQFSPLLEGKIFGAQAIGGTGALRLGAEFLAQTVSRTIYITDPTWPNHRPVFSRAGMKVESYPYYDEVNHQVDFEAICAAVKAMLPLTVIVLQPSCHNPTGMDLSFSQWQELSDLIKRQNIFPFFDFAYQGFGKDLEEDARPIRFFAEQGHEMIVANSFSKNFGLYGERVGLVSIVTHHPEAAKKAGSHIKQIIRGSYSNPPRYGAAIIASILKSDRLKKGWKKELQAMRDRIVEMREALTFGLMETSIHKDFSFLSRQNGIFSFSGLTKEQVLQLREEKGIYILENSRMCIAGLNSQNLEFVVESIADVIKK